MMSKYALKRMRQHAFTLLEVMIVVAIIGILAAIATDGYRGYRARARRPAARIALRALADAQRAHKISVGVYASTFDELNFVIEGGARVSATEIQGRIYNYKLSQPLGPDGWYCIATGNIDGDEFIDMLSVQNID